MGYAIVCDVLFDFGFFFLSVSYYHPLLWHPYCRRNERNCNAHFFILHIHNISHRQNYMLIGILTLTSHKLKLKRTFWFQIGLYLISRILVLHTLHILLLSA